MTASTANSMSVSVNRQDKKHGKNILINRNKKKEFPYQ